MAAQVDTCTEEALAVRANWKVLGAGGVRLFDRFLADRLFGFDDSDRAGFIDGCACCYLAAPSLLKLPHQGVDTEDSNSLQDFCVQDRVLPSQVQFLVEASMVDLVQFPSSAGVEGPGSRFVKKYRADDNFVYLWFATPNDAFEFWIVAPLASLELLVPQKLAEDMPTEDSTSANPPMNLEDSDRAKADVKIQAVESWLTFFFSSDLLLLLLLFLLLLMLLHLSLRSKEDSAGNFVIFGMPLIHYNKLAKCWSLARTRLEKAEKRLNQIEAQAKEELSTIQDKRPCTEIKATLLQNVNDSTSFMVRYYLEIFSII
ncbi:unnamed protein product [Dibothriocephalus latus]|uniref:Uncharacterized protein n=1 Tax=Dibothriocephalus latus TaxID=60516 RepID=A0A3P6UYT8_DIBLA|nr:unnamed protein product [Dibothriocephalus latus]